ncbi:DEAD/DEAH box helicase [Myxococcota bacterium]
MIPSALSAQLQQGLTDFLRYSFWSSTHGMDRVIDDLMAEHGGVTKGPYLSVKLPFESGGRADFFPDVPLPYPPHAHQTISFERLGRRRKLSTLVATGTGSGKTECFLMPILDYCHRETATPGVKAILIYPMNALATDQAGRIARMVHENDRLRGRVTAGLYIGESRGAAGGGTGGRRSKKRSRRTGEETMSARSIITDRETMQKHPPDILLTNYKMLDYLLLRPWDQGIWRDNQRGVLRFLVVDELHTFDGAQGTDLACLIRRLKRRLQVDDGSLCCIGTSATLGGEQSKERLRHYAEEVFGEPFDQGALIGESRKDASAFLADAPVEHTDEPGEEDLAALQPASALNPEEWIRAQVLLWLGATEGLNDESSSLRDTQWAVALGEHLRRHATFRALLGLLDGRVAAVDEVVQSLSRSRSGWRKNPALASLAVQSLMGLASVARSWQPELDSVRAAREARGESAPTRPFLDIRLQLWQRELRRMVATVATPSPDGIRPRLRFSDDLDREQRRRHLPLIHCRDCGAMGWATRIDRDKPHVYRTDLHGFYRAFFKADSQVRFLYPETARPVGDPAWENYPVLRVDTGKLVRLDGDEEPEPGSEAAELLVIANTRAADRKHGQKQVLHRDCPFCGARESLALVGSRAATLTSVYVDQIFASRFNDEGEKKLLTFSDSVQDAAHRAGFFGARTWRTNLRVALRRVIQEGNEGVRLSELPDVFNNYWRSRLDEPTWVATFLAPNMAWLHDWDALQQDGELPEDSDLPHRVERRLAFEIAQEFGHQATIGRSLPRTRAATAYLDPKLLQAACEALPEPMRNEVPGLREMSEEQLRAFVVGLVYHLRTRGAVHHRELPTEFLESGGERLWKFKQEFHLPAFAKTSRMPAFLQDRSGSRRFDTWSSPKSSKPSWYERWVTRCFTTDEGLGVIEQAVYPVVLTVLTSQGVLEEIAGKRGERIWGVKDKALLVQSDVVGLCCERCQHRVQIGANEVDDWREVSCLTARCSGRYETDETETADYFGRLYAVGDLQRIFTAEHTGLLSREEREKIEREFKAESVKRAGAGSGENQGDDGFDQARKPWYPNLLSCTPTLEMGIDIGDLSSTILCSVPPTQANYLQRIGRAGRRDGNSMVLTVANARPHDLYMYATPEEMMTGDVTPPGVFLDASAVLERQLTAFCFDRWVAKEGEAATLPHRLGDVFAHLDDEGSAHFPHNLLTFVERDQPSILREFREMFAGAITEATEQHLRLFLEGGDQGEQSLQWRLLEACHRERKQRESLRSKARKLTKDLKKLQETEAKPLDFDEQVSRMEEEKEALQALIRQMDGRQTLEFFTDEGMLPNYAFPESAVRLNSVIWRKKKRIPSQGSKYDTWTYEYVRSPSSALTELAPQADFYAGGRRVRIDQVDVSVTEIETWRFCDLCNHAQRIDFGEQTTSCPACGSNTWVDDDQKLRLLPLKQVFANAPDRESRIRDDRDDRQPRFFQRQVLIAHHEEDRQGAWSIDDPGVPFGFEYLRRATFREVNFGEHTDQGAKFRVAGREAVRPGFQICARCGKVQLEGKDPQHTLSCPTQAAGAKPTIEQCLYLYREFSSEALRLLLPLPDQAQLNSFVAALQLGLRERFGGSVDHLRTMVYSEPDRDSSLRKQYLVLFDTVPGGTGYVKQLVTPRKKGGTLPIFEALELARLRLEGCSCWSDPDRDGCYQCLLGYRNARDMDDTSARAAVEQIRQILGKKDRLKEISSLSDVSVRGLMDSVLEARFIEVLRQAKAKDRSGKLQPAKLKTAIVNRRPGYRLSLGEQEWVIEPQVDVGPAGLGMKVSIDFVLRRGNAATESEHRPIAVFLDGWQYHRDRIGLDLLQRMALMASGQWDVWSFTWWDLDEVLTTKPNPCANVLHPDLKQLRDLFSKSGLGGLKDLAERPILQLFLSDLSSPVTAPWEHIGSTLLASRMTPPEDRNLSQWKKAVTTYAPSPARPSLTAKQPRLACIDDGELNPWVSLFAILDGTRVLTLAVLDDREENLEESGFRDTWNGFLRLFQLLRFQQNAWFLTRSWIDRKDYSHVVQLRADPGEAAWSDIEEVLEDFRPLCDALMKAGLPQPEIGMDVPSQAGRTWAEAELVWEGSQVAVTDRQRAKVAEGKIADGWQIFILGDLDTAEVVSSVLKREGS